MVIIKQSCEDFIVNEITNVRASLGDYCYFWLQKKNYTTVDAIKIVAAALRVNKIGFAGNKDKKAVTNQLCSAYKVKKEKLEKFRFNNIELKFFGYGSKPISLGDLKGNEFIIIVRDVNNKQLNELAKLRKKLSIVNYFDEQRFSEHNVEIGKSIVKKDFRKAVELVGDGLGNYNMAVRECIVGNKNYIQALLLVPRKILMLFVHAYQSWLWNESAKEFVGSGRAVKYSEGTFIFPDKIANIRIPLVGFGTEIKDAKLREIINKIMVKENITFRDFIVREMPALSVEGNERDLMVNVNVKAAVEKETVTLSFKLPKGSYATIVVKYLF